MSQREPEVNDNVYVPGKNPESYAYMYQINAPSRWLERRANAMIRDINGEEVFVDYYNGDFETHDVCEFTKYENHMWVLD